MLFSRQSYLALTLLFASAWAACPSNYQVSQGTRTKDPSKPEVYLIDPEGYRRHIPNEDTFNRLFRSWDGIVSDTNALCIKEGPPLDATEAKIVKSRQTENYYIADKPVPNSSLVTYRWIIAPEVMDKNNFKWENPALVNQSVIDRQTDYRYWG